jgi:hypothetical protein
MTTKKIITVKVSPEVKQDTPQDTQPENKRLFQAIGVINGSIKFIAREGKKAKIAIVKLQDKEYVLSGVYIKMAALEKHIAANGDTQRLVVYPKVTHYPRPKDGEQQPPKISFQLVGFGGHSVLNELKDNEFKFSGIWQFIPVCKTPCITVMKNYTDDRKEFIKQADVVKKVSFMKASHLPLFWRDAIIPAFRFKPRATKEEQGKASFLSIKAKFIVSRNVFGFDSLIEMPTQDIPRHLKAKKADKSTVQNINKKRKKDREKAQESLQQKTA